MVVFLLSILARKLLKEYMTRKGKEIAQFGEWHLWVYMCAWRIDYLDKPLIGADDDREKIAKSLVHLNNKRLEHFKVINLAYDAILKFESGYELKLFSFNVSENRQWLFYTPENMTFVAGPGSEWSYKNSDE